MAKNYEIQRRLTTTLYGDLFEAKDKRDGSKVAIKVSTKSTTRGENPQREIALLQKLHSETKLSVNGREYLIALHDSYETQLEGKECFCCVLEYADHGDMLERILDLQKRDMHMSFEDVQRYFLQIATGLNYIHSCGICHLDISLENILITKQDNIRICDFGQAEAQRWFSGATKRKGKIKYTCPEVANKKGFDGQKADVWSLGVVLWALLTGSLLYEVPLVSDTRFRHLLKGREGLKILLALNEVDDVSPSAVDLLSHMLDIDSNARWTVKEVLAHEWCTKSLSPLALLSPVKDKSVDLTPLHKISPAAPTPRVDICTFFGEDKWDKSASSSLTSSASSTPSSMVESISLLDRVQSVTSTSSSLDRPQSLPSSIDGPKFPTSLMLDRAQSLSAPSEHQTLSGITLTLNTLTPTPPSPLSITPSPSSCGSFLFSESESDKPESDKPESVLAKTGLESLPYVTPKRTSKSRKQWAQGKTMSARSSWSYSAPESPSPRSPILPQHATTRTAPIWAPSPISSKTVHTGTVEQQTLNKMPRSPSSPSLQTRELSASSSSGGNLLTSRSFNIEKAIFAMSDSLLSLMKPDGTIASTDSSLTPKKTR